MADSWTVQDLATGVVQIKFERRLWCLVTSDWHWDSVHCDREKLEADLRIAKRLNAPVLSLGDHFDVMGGKYDPRSNGKHDIRQELQIGNYFDEVIRQGAKWLEPYKHQMALISLGNHETAVRKRQETCLTTRLVERLRFLGSPVRQGPYAGWVLFKSLKNTRTCAVYKLWYHHGYGGGGPVTRGVIDFSRYLVDVDADAVASGHIHQRTLIEAQRQRLSAHGIPRVKPLYLVRSSTYKREDLTDGWSVERGMSARPMGGWWLRLKWNTKNDDLVGTWHDTPVIGETRNDDDGSPARSERSPEASRARPAGKKAVRRRKPPDAE